jgi:hypothetical protein
MCILVYVRKCIYIDVLGICIYMFMCMYLYVSMYV